MKTQSITADFVKTICWQGNSIVDWASGIRYELDGTKKHLDYHYPYDFDSAINSRDGVYVFFYQKLGTKGLLLKNGDIVKEINRSYYCANAYEFPAVFVTLENTTYLIHCPIAYNQLDFENVETGEIITNIDGRDLSDRFYSRLEVSPNSTFLMSKGWVWHPLDEIVVFDIIKCLNNPKLLDDPQLCPNVGVEICTASFIDDETVVIGSSDEIFNEDNIECLPPKHIALWDLKTNELSKPVRTKDSTANLYAIDSSQAWDMFCFPKIVNIITGETIAENKEIDSGKQNSSIINIKASVPAIIFNNQTKQIAIMADEKITVLSLY
ncbi:hypothetical protein MUGA111182_19645 [Mucilaginibacter galii]|uniref:Uncharacterized protein n=1 Tax=Mucilaginibacter galii TaxID=2005073 RepID=A0A917J617_9SPHI|nr:hypothetical protein [Mucilaginibacter galii]GGI49329.1 hypothetical protein GCM10011425_05410 [Mucilaginibacter galii]